MGGCASKENAAKEQKKEDDTGFVQFLLMSHAWVNSTMSMGRAWNYVEASLYVVFPVSWLYILSMHFAFSFFFSTLQIKTSGRPAFDYNQIFYIDVPQSITRKIRNSAWNFYT